jgi:hypothetical protein
VVTTPIAAAAETRSIGRGAWSYFGDPRAVYGRGTTFVGWASPRGEVQVASIDARGRSRTVTLDRTGRDDHNNPSLLLRRDGRIVAFYAPHENMLVPVSRRYRMFYRVTQRPYDVRRWGPVRAVPGNTAPLPGQPQRGVAYPNPIQTSDGRVWLFWRGGSWWPTLSWTDDFRRWSRPRNVVRGIRGLRPYVKYADDGSGIDMAFTESHPNRRHTSVYFLRIRRDGEIRDDRGRKVGTVKKGVDYRRAGVVYRYSRKKGSAWVMDVAIDRDGVPVVLYIRKRADEHRGVYHYARLENGRWVDRAVVPAGKGRGGGWYYGGATLDHEDPNVLYVSRRPGRARAEIETWTTPDGGRSWTQTAVTRRSKSNNWRPVSPRGDPGTSVLWFSGRYDSFVDFSTNVFMARGSPEPPG